jgi:hypothetical protein
MPQSPIQNPIILPDLSKYTVTQIKEWTKANNLKVPSGLKKVDLIQYLTGIVQEKNKVL